jgi:hypothetical protein
MGLREYWHFGLKYLDKVSNEWNWLQMNRAVGYLNWSENEGNIFLDSFPTITNIT